MGLVLNPPLDFLNDLTAIDISFVDSFLKISENYSWDQQALVKKIVFKQWPCADRVKVDHAICCAPSGLLARALSNIITNPEARADILMICKFVNKLSSSISYQ